MMGLLDPTDDPRTMGLLSLGLGLLGSKGSFGNALSQAGPQALQAMQQVKDRQRQAQSDKQRQALQAMQMQQAQAAIQAQQQAQQRQAAVEGAYRGALTAGPDGSPQVDQSALIRRLTQADPMAAFQMLQPKSADYKVVDDALVSVGPQGVKEVYRAPQKAESKPEIVKILERLHGEGTPAFMQALRQYQVKATTHAPAPSANVTVGGPVFEKEYSKDQGKQFSELMGGITKAGFSAPSQIRKLERMEQLLDGVDGGKLAPTGLDIASAANSIGIKIDPKLGNKEAAQALAREIAGGFRQPGTGPMTDKDFENFLLQVPDLSKTAAGRKQITATMKAAAARDLAVAKMARAYERKNGRLDSGFMDEVAQYVAENPVVGLPSGWKVR